MVMSDIAELIKGYYCLVNKHGEFIYLQYSPFDGSELSGGFLHALEVYVRIYLMEHEGKYKDLFRIWCENLKQKAPDANFNLIPNDLKYLLTDRSWYEKEKFKERKKHQAGKFCWEFNCFVDTDCRSDFKTLPKLARVPILYCPFCGVKLPPEFNQENWWDKEFKTFKWDKDHKLGEWADDFVDDAADWDYPSIENEKKE